MSLRAWLPRHSISHLGRSHPHRVVVPAFPSDSVEVEMSNKALRVTRHHCPRSSTMRTLRVLTTANCLHPTCDRQLAATPHLPWSRGPLRQTQQWPSRRKVCYKTTPTCNQWQRARKLSPVARVQFASIQTISTSECTILSINLYKTGLWGPMSYHRCQGAVRCWWWWISLETAL